MEGISETEKAEAIIAIRRMGKWEKIIAIILGSGIITVIGWVAVTSHVDAQQTQDIKEVKQDIRAIRDTLPKLNTKQLLSQKDVEQLQKDVAAIKNNQEKNNDIVLDIAGKISYLVDRSKEKK